MSMETKPDGTLFRWLASTFIALVLFAQAATIPFTAARRGDMLWLRLYPILEYDMYRESHQEGEDVMASYLIDLADSSGQVLPVSRQMLGLEIWDYNALVEGVLVHKQGNKLAALVNLVHKQIRGSDNFSELRVKSLGLRVTRNGPERVDSKVLMTVPLSAAASTPLGQPNR